MQLEDDTTPTGAVAPVIGACGPHVFHRAVEVLRTRHHVSESVAYRMLVRASVEAGTSVREAAGVIIGSSLARS